MAEAYVAGKLSADPDVAGAEDVGDLEYAGDRHQTEFSAAIQLTGIGYALRLVDAMAGSVVKDMEVSQREVAA